LGGTSSFTRGRKQVCTSRPGGGEKGKWRGERGEGGRIVGVKRGGGEGPSKHQTKKKESFEKGSVLVENRQTKKVNADKLQLSHKGWSARGEKLGGGTVTIDEGEKRLNLHKITVKRRPRPKYSRGERFQRVGVGDFGVVNKGRERLSRIGTPKLMSIKSGVKKRKKKRSPKKQKNPREKKKERKEKKNNEPPTTFGGREGKILYQIKTTQLGAQKGEEGVKPSQERHAKKRRFKIARKDGEAKKAVDKKKKEGQQKRRGRGKCPPYWRLGEIMVVQGGRRKGGGKKKMVLGGRKAEKKKKKGVGNCSVRQRKCAGKQNKSWNGTKKL